jgi:hypothetical protein
LTALQPALTAPSISFSHTSSEPLWLMPISAITNTGCSRPTGTPPMKTTG